MDGASCVDYEDISIGPGPNGSSYPHLYIGDVGNNGMDRDTLQIYRFPEPDLIGLE